MPTLQFKGKTLVENLHLGVPYHELLPVRDKGLSQKATLKDNMIISGDNLLGLKALLPTYHGKVKCIYIDPPYNIGTENWRYNDRVNSPMMQEWFGKVVDREDLTRHDKWLCMMLPRLKLLRELLRDDGAILVSIDDNEVHRLRCLMDEIFGEDNFLGSFVWEGTVKNDAHFISVGHDYVLCYAKRIESLRANRTRWRVLKEGVDEVQQKAQEFLENRQNDFEAASQDLRSWFSSLDKGHKAFAHRHYRCIDSKGVYFPGDISWPSGEGPTYEVLHPDTGRPVKVPATGWRFSKQETMQQAISEGRVHFAPDETRVPNLKRYLADTDHQVLTSVFYRDRRAAHKDLVHVLPDADFEYPKDESIIRRLLEAVTSGDDIVLDSFAGSGTTAHAVLALNKQDGGNRRFILIECEDYIDSTTAERVRRVIKGVPSAKDESLEAGLGGTFSYFELGNPLQRESLLRDKDLPNYERLASYIFFTATGQEFEPDKIDESRWFIGSTSYVDVFLIYSSDVETLKDLALVKSIAQELVNSERSKFVFAPAKYVDSDFLGRHNISFQQLPFEIYEAVDRFE